MSAAQHVVESQTSKSRARRKRALLVRNQMWKSLHPGNSDKESVVDAVLAKLVFVESLVLDLDYATSGKFQCYNQEYLDCSELKCAAVLHHLSPHTPEYHPHVDTPEFVPAEPEKCEQQRNEADGHGSAQYFADLLEACSTDNFAKQFSKLLQNVRTDDDQSDGSYFGNML